MPNSHYTLPHSEGANTSANGPLEEMRQSFAVAAFSYVVDMELFVALHPGAAVVYPGHENNMSDSRPK